MSDGICLFVEVVRNERFQVSQGVRCIVWFRGPDLLLR